MPRGVYPRRPKVELPALGAPPGYTGRVTGLDAGGPRPYQPGDTCGTCHWFDADPNPLQPGWCYRYPALVAKKAQERACGEWREKPEGALREAEGER